MFFSIISRSAPGICVKIKSFGYFPILIIWKLGFIVFWFMKFLIYELIWNSFELDIWSDELWILIYYYIRNNLTNKPDRLMRKLFNEYGAIIIKEMCQISKFLKIMFFFSMLDMSFLKRTVKNDFATLSLFTVWSSRGVVGTQLNICDGAFLQK